MTAVRVETNDPLVCHADSGSVHVAIDDDRGVWLVFRTEAHLDTWLEGIDRQRMNGQLGVAS